MTPAHYTGTNNLAHIGSNHLTFVRFAAAFSLLTDSFEHVPFMLIHALASRCLST